MYVCVYVYIYICVCDSLLGIYIFVSILYIYIFFFSLFPHIGYYIILIGLPRWLSGKESACQCRSHRRRGFDPWVRKIPWKRKWWPTPVFLPGKSRGQLSLMGYSPWGLKESDMTEWLYIHYTVAYITFAVVLQLGVHMCVLPTGLWTLQGQRQGLIHLCHCPIPSTVPRT